MGPDGQALWKYGIEWQHYDVQDSVKFFINSELLNTVTRDRQLLRDLNIYASASGSRWASFLGNTIVNDVQNFSEYSYRYLARGEQERRSEYLFENYYKDMSVGNFYDELMVSSFLNDKEQFNDLRDLLNNSYKNIMIEAFFQSTFDAGSAVLNNYRQLLDNAGMEDFKDYLREVNREKPGLITITTVKYLEDCCFARKNIQGSGLSGTHFFSLSILYVFSNVFVLAFSRTVIGTISSVFLTAMAAYAIKGRLLGKLFSDFSAHYDAV